MSKQATRRAPQKRRPQQRKGRTAMAAKGGRGTNRTTWIMVGIVVIVGVALLAAVASGHKKKQAGDFLKGDKPAPASLVSKVTGVSEKVINDVGKGSTQSLPTALPAGPPLKTSDGKPRIVYIGAEYCPYCATERWAMVNALSRFGTFSDLKITSSAKTAANGAPEVFPGTGTFSFNGSTYKSDYIQFQPVEQFDNSYKPLETTPPDLKALEDRYNKGGSIPFIDFANQYLISGASYDPRVLESKTRTEIADELTNSSSSVTQGVVGVANSITATICKLIDNKGPTNVCTQPAIQDLQKQL
jgi:hypothetical protein